MSKRRPRVLGVKVAEGFSAEARVFASVFGHRNDRFDAHVLYHPWTPERPGILPDHAERFAETAMVTTSLVDFGWEPNWGVPRPRRLQLRSKFQLARALPRAISEAKRFDPDIIYCSQQRADLAVATAISTALRRPKIVHLHYNVGPWLGRFTLRELRKTRAVVTVSDFIAEQARSHGAHHVTPILNTVTVPSLDCNVADEEREILGVPRGGVIVGMVARLDPDKGQMDLIDAFASLNANVPVYLCLVGEGAFERDLRARAARFGIADRVLFLGQRNDARERLLPSFDIFAHPSSNDPCPLALLEASAQGLPVVAYRSGGAPEVVVHGVTGFTVSHKDVAALGQAMRSLVADPNLRKTMGSAARQRMADSFQPGHAGGQFATLVESLSSQPRPSR